LQLRVDAVGFDDVLGVDDALGVDHALAVGGAGAVVVAGDLGFAAGFDDVLACDRADGWTTAPLAVLTTWIMAVAAASARPVPPRPICAAAFWLTGCATSESWAA
jgi:hypothetical protein